jgi:hypothetical protein
MFSNGPNADNKVIKGHNDGSASYNDLLRNADLLKGPDAVEVGAIDRIPDKPGADTPFQRGLFGMFLFNL